MFNAVSLLVTWKAETVYTPYSDVSDIHEILYDINQKLDVKPWATEPTLKMDKYGKYVVYMMSFFY